MLEKVLHVLHAGRRSGGVMPSPGRGRRLEGPMSVVTRACSRAPVTTRGCRRPGAEVFCAVPRFMLPAPSFRAWAPRDAAGVSAFRVGRGAMSHFSSRAVGYRRGAEDGSAGRGNGHRAAHPDGGVKKPRRPFPKPPALGSGRRAASRDRRSGVSEGSREEITALWPDRVGRRQRTSRERIGFGSPTATGRPGRRRRGSGCLTGRWGGRMVDGDQSSGAEPIEPRLWREGPAVVLP